VIIGKLSSRCSQTYMRLTRPVGYTEVMDVDTVGPFPSIASINHNSKAIIKRKSRNWLRKVAGWKKKSFQWSLHLEPLTTICAREASVIAKSARSVWYLALVLQPWTSAVIISHVFSPSLTSTVTSRCAARFSVFLKVSKIMPTPTNRSWKPWSSPSE
jgi:hypothetical protein